MWEGLFALGGVVLGAILGAVGKWWLDRAQRQADRQAARRLELLELVSAFIRDADAVWMGRTRLVSAVVEIQHDKASPHGHAERLAAFDDLRTPTIETRLAVARMRLTAPELVPPAEALLKASFTYTMDNHDRDIASRADALRAFEEAARPLLSW